ncbi:MAG TPA: helix-turn-helix transcriptional regulator [Ideonella sp.]|jgi:AraC-like DNA-binding protein|nr:helix-turn-helix transcriptional regulator [Ideonella sp.]
MRYDDLHWDMFLRGAVAGLLLFHLVNLALPGPRPAARAALGAFVLSVLAYLFCQQADIVFSTPRPLTFALMALCVGSPAWMWLSARALFNDDFRLTGPLLAPPLAVMLLGLAANLPYLPEFAGALDAGALAWLGRLHAIALLGFTVLALWEVARGRQDDLVEPRRAARRWVVLGIGLYALVALVVELAVHGHAVGRLLPALHVAGIGSLALALAVLVARRSLGELLGVEPPSAVPSSAPSPAPPPRAPAPPPPSSTPSPALTRLMRAMTEERAYRREGLTVASLAADLGMGEAALRSLINHELGHRNFNDFLHLYRLQEACQRLVNEDLPVLTIALECGYGSIGPFNRAFRERMGMTPSEYRGASRLGRDLGAPSTN